jgi:hypothetical protein
MDQYWLNRLSIKMQKDSDIFLHNRHSMHFIRNSIWSFRGPSEQQKQPIPIHIDFIGYYDGKLHYWTGD